MSNTCTRIQRKSVAFCRQAYRRSDGRSPMGRSALRTSARKSSTRNGSNFRPAPQPAGLLRCVAPPPAAAPIGPTRDRFSLALAEFVTGSCSTSPHKCVSVGCTCGSGKQAPAKNLLELKTRCRLPTASCLGLRPAWRNSFSARAAGSTNTQRSLRGTSPPSAGR